MKDTIKKARPFLKWVGGKGQILNQLEVFFPKKFNNYFEPFVGGGAVFFHLKPERAYLNDVNSTLMHTYKLIKNEPEKLIKGLDSLEKKYKTLEDSKRKDFFLDVRSKYNDSLDNFERSVYLIFLNKTCFNGMYRENSKGGFNVPFGSYKNPKILDRENLNSVSQSIKKATLLNKDFVEAVKNAKRGDFIYLDPPYYPINKTSQFTTYSKNNFLEKEQVRLKDLFVELDKRGCFVLLSNSNTEFIRRLYNGYKQEEILAGRSINSVGSKRGKILELAVRNY